MRLLPSPRTVRRAVLGMALGAAAGWVYGLLQKPAGSTAPAGSSLAAPTPPAEPPAPVEMVHAAPAPEVADVAAPVRKATTRARAKLTQAMEASQTDGAGTGSAAAPAAPAGGTVPAEASATPPTKAPPRSRKKPPPSAGD
jgi:hypothetical protein